MFDLRLLQELFRNEYSLELTSFSSAFLMKTIEERMNEMNISSFPDYVSRLMDNKQETGLLYNSLYITFTQFFRSTLTFALLEQVILPKIIFYKERSVSSQVRIWSAGCSSGQEAYSVAFMLADILQNRKSPISWRIFATDVSSELLDIAVKGEYAYNLVENLKVIHIENYFTHRGNSYLINKGIREHIHFSVYDLLDGDSISPPQSIFGDFDIIMCSNVMLYYNHDVQAKLMEKFYRSLADKGYLVAGDDETGIIRSNSRFTPAFPGSPIYYKL